MRPGIPLVSIAALIATYVVIAAVINTVHFQFFTVEVVLFDTLVDMVLAAVVTALLYWSVLRHRLRLTAGEALLSILAGLLIGANYAIAVPTVIDRSLSMYILEKLQQRGGGIRRDAFEQVFKDEYMVEHRLVDIRLTEQLQSGTIRIVDGCVVLTDAGRRIATFTRFYRTHLLPRKRKIMGVYTDDLTDPFRASKSEAGYRCPAP